MLKDLNPPVINIQRPFLSMSDQFIGLGVCTPSGDILVAKNDNLVDDSKAETKPCNLRSTIRDTLMSRFQITVTIQRGWFNVSC